MEAKNLQIKYDDKVIIRDANIKVNDGEIVTIIGPNGSGKTSLIKALSRYIKTSGGSIYLRGQDILSIPTKEIARKLAILPQVKHSLPDITIEKLVSYGRYPHLSFGQRLNNKDKEIIDWAMGKTGIINLKDRYMGSLSGGENQRTWISMALAQKPEILILDEPTTYLDISYQLEVLELVKDLNKTLGLTVIMVLHDLNQAARYSDKIFVLKEGQVCGYGKPRNIINPSLIEDVFRIESTIYEDEVNNCPYFIGNKII